MIAAGCGVAGSAGAERRSRERLSIDLRKTVTLAGMHTHLLALQRIADANAGHRAAGTSGYAASVRYVRTTLERAGLRVRLQPFPYAGMSRSSSADGSSRPSRATSSSRRSSTHRAGR